MSNMQWKSVCGIILIVLTGCNPYNSARQNTVPAVQSPSQSTQGEPSATSTQIRSSTPYSSPTPASLPLSEPGPFFVGKHTYTIKDESRNGREIRLMIYYPAVMHTDSYGNPIVMDAEPDRSGSLYPLIITGPDSGGYLFKSHLASYGFVMAIVHSPGPTIVNWDFWVIDYPRDFIFTLNLISANPPKGLENVIDTNQVGVTGYSGDGSISLAVSGARIDPNFYLSFCEHVSSMEPPVSDWYIKLTCTLSKKWDEFASYAGDQITVSDDGLWQPITDERIRAVMPMAPDGAWLYGDRGLAMADRPVFIIAPTNDEYTPYQIETAYIYDNIGTTELYMVSFIDKKHMMVMQTEPSRELKHFAVAFFGYYLQGKSEYSYYFSQEFVSEFEDLAWGKYEGD